MLALESPLDAYRSDLARNKHRLEFGGEDTVWLLAAHCLSRLSRASSEDRNTIAVQCAAALRDFLSPHVADSSALNQNTRDLELVVEGLEGIMQRPGADALARGIRGMSSRMADSGALSTAYTTIGHAREIVGAACDRERGLLAADQAFIARLLGDLETAEELYQVASSIGEQGTDFALLSRACIGRGVISRVRGNYPRARIFFERALELAETAKSTDLVLLSHQGLTICFAIARDFDRALRHGWATFECSTGDAGREAEALGNLAHLCLDAGYPRAALQGFAAVLQRSDVLRICLSVLGGAAVAAAQAGELEVLRRVSAEAERRILHSALPYENAQTLYSLGTAYAIVGEAVRSDEFLTRTRRLAKARGFFELLHATEGDELTRATAKAAPAGELSEPSRSVIASLSSIDIGATAEVLAIAR